MKIGILICFIFIVGFAFAQNESINDAQLSLNNSLNIINELQEKGFNVDYINDIYSEAQIVMQQAVYVEILSDPSISEAGKLKAKSALKLVSWKNISYTSVLYYTSLISQYRLDTYEIFDSITALNMKSVEYKERGVDVSISDVLISSANDSFYKGQYVDAFSYVDKARLQLETDFEQISTVNLLTENAKNFVYRYLYWIIFLFLVICLIIYFSAGYIYVRILKGRIAKMEVEEKVLNRLIERTQNERYKENKLSELVYNIRVRKYQARLSEIKQDIPVLKRKLQKL
jgi:hypothetical protein